MATKPRKTGFFQDWKDNIEMNMAAHPLGITWKDAIQGTLFFGSIIIVLTLATSYFILKLFF